jgi:hypothetical protein
MPYFIASDAMQASTCGLLLLLADGVDLGINFYLPIYQAD